MRVLNAKYIIFVFVLVCSVQEFIHANEYNNYTNECNDYVNICISYANKCSVTCDLTLKNVKVNNPTKWTLDKSDFRLPFSSNIFEDFSFGNTSNQCKDSLIMYLNAIMHLQPWAIEMFDATGKPPSSFLHGTVLDFGSFDDCLRIKVHSDDESFLFKGQYCMIHLKHPLFQPSSFKTENGKDYVDSFGHPPDWIRDRVNGDISNRFGLYLGLCIPSLCTEEDLHNIIKTIAEQVPLSFAVTDCTVEIEKENEYKQLPFSAKFAIVIITVFLILWVTGTTLDLLDLEQLGKKLHPHNSINRELLKSFSLYTNAKRVFALSPKKTPIDCLTGLRVVYCLWVTAGHYMVYTTVYKELRYRNLHYSQEFLKPELLMVFLNNGLFVVEGFFFISGFLLVYTLWHKIEQTGGKIGILENIFSRYYRVTPGHLFIIVISFILPFISSGPVWKSSWEHEQGNCLRNGWKNLLYLHNFDDIMDICYLHTWYIGVNMQFVVIFVPLLVVIYKYPKCGLFVCLTLLFGSMVHNYNVSVKEGFLFGSYNHLKIPETAMHFVTSIYLKTFYHFSSNLIGMLAAWIVLKYKNCKLSKVSLLTGWSFCVLCFTISLYGVYLPVTDIRVGALHTATRNTIYSLGLFWIVYVCSTGYGGVVDKILSWKAFAPISRISYSLYLVNPFSLVLRDAALTERFYMDKIAHVPEIIPYFLISFIMGFIFFVTVEEPVNKVYDLLKKRYTTSSHKPSSSVHPTTNGTGKEKRME